MMRRLGVDVIFALSPQAKGKIERPYRWMQDRIVRTCALEKITELGEVRAVLREEVDRYTYPGTGQPTPGTLYDGGNASAAFCPHPLRRKLTLSSLLCSEALFLTGRHLLPS